MEIVIFGSGNVAWSLGHSFQQSGMKVLKIISRNIQTGKKLADSLFAEFIPLNACEYKFSTNTICFLTFPDDILRKLAPTYRINNGIVVHTAGSVSIDILKPINKNVGVFYPLQTFRSEMTVKMKYPILIDSVNKETLEKLKVIASSISNKVEVADDLKREKVHLAAVMVNNFTNHLYTLTADFCKQEGIDFKLLTPLIQETIHRIEHSDPSMVQTGPARRNDRITLNRHYQMIKDDPELQKLYSYFTDSIMNYYNKENN